MSKSCYCACYTVPRLVRTRLLGVGLTLGEHSSLGASAASVVCWCHRSASSWSTDCFPQSTACALTPRPESASTWRLWRWAHTARAPPRPSLRGEVLVPPVGLVRPARDGRRALGCCTVLLVSRSSTLAKGTGAVQPDRSVGSARLLLFCDTHAYQVHHGSGRLACCGRPLPTELIQPTRPQASRLARWCGSRSRARGPAARPHARMRGSGGGRAGSAPRRGSRRAGRGAIQGF
jgi:hypothetical protein